MSGTLFDNSSGAAPIFYSAVSAMPEVFNFQGLPGLRPIQLLCRPDDGIVIDFEDTAEVAFRTFLLPGLGAWAA